MVTFFTPDLLLGEDINQYGLATYTSIYLQEPNKLTANNFVHGLKKKQNQKK